METSYIVIGVIVAIIIVALLSFEKTREPFLEVIGQIIAAPLGCLGCLGCGGCLTIIVLIVGLIIFGPAMVSIVSSIIVFLGGLVGRSIVKEDIMEIFMKTLGDSF